MKCPEFDHVLHEFFIGEMDPGKREGLDSHAAECKRCGNLLKTAYELSCKEFVEFLNEYIDDALSPERRAAFERHLAICPQCTAYLKSYRTAIDLAGASASEADKDLVKEMPDDLVKAIVESMKRG